MAKVVTHTAAQQNLSVSRLLLRQARDVMASPETAQTRLNELVKAIAATLRVEVCSVYLLRAGDVLELFANVGLKQEAVHQTRLRVGEGLVGEIAATASPLNLAHAQDHPKFAYRPETGEEVYRSFLGVPVLGSGQTVAVLVIQSAQERAFTDEEVEALQTVAMALAELVGSGRLVQPNEITKASGAGFFARHITGTRLAPGLTKGPAVLHRPKAVVTKAVAEDSNVENERLDKAVRTLQRWVDALIESTDSLGEDDERREIMETYRMFSNDRGWLEKIREGISGGLTAEAAVKKVQQQMRERLHGAASAYLRARLDDLDDLSNRLIQVLQDDGEKKHQGLPPRFVLVAGNLGPAELLEYGRNRIKGLILEEGSSTSHIVIIARAMDIPVVGRVEGAAELIRSGDPVVVDGDNGEVYIRPAHAVEQSIDAQIRHKRRMKQAYAAQAPLPATTVDGVSVSLNINAGLFMDLNQLQESGADGIGLYRTELPYMVADAFPDVDAQARIYGEVRTQAAGRKVIFRTFDIGSDKQVPYFPLPPEENPAMGWRATRIALDRPGILRRQLRALIIAAKGEALHVMFPFVAHAGEFDELRGHLNTELLRADADGIVLPSAVKVGVMIEVPSILFQLDTLLPRVDFVSVGSNDLLQFLFAADRGSPEMSDRYDTLSPVFLDVIRHVVDACKRHGVEVGFCGEMARHPLEAMALVALGVSSLSMPPGAIGPVKAMVRSMSQKAVRAYLDELCGASLPSIRQNLYHFAKDHGIVV